MNFLQTDHIHRILHARLNIFNSQVGVITPHDFDERNRFSNESEYITHRDSSATHAWLSKMDLRINGYPIVRHNLAAQRETTTDFTDITDTTALQRRRPFINNP